MEKKVERHLSGWGDEEAQSLSGSLRQNFFFLLPVGLSGTTVLRPQLRLLQGSPCHSLTLGGVRG